MYASSNGAIQNRDHFAFGWGRRICPGIYLVSSPFLNQHRLILFHRLKVKSFTFLQKFWPQVQLNLLFHPLVKKYIQI